MNDLKSNLCECGCGQLAPIAAYTSVEKGWIKGRPIRFINYHHITGTLNERLDRKTKKGLPGECWMWKGFIHRHGYGYLHVNGHQIGAHRLWWERVNGPIPTGMAVCHACDIRGCVNPGHLFIGTAKDNLLDMRVKGRGAFRFRNEDIPVIRALFDSGITNREIARRFKAPESTVQHVTARDSWKHVQEHE